MAESRSIESASAARVDGSIPAERLSQGVLFSLVGNGVFVLCQWLYIVLLARAGSVATVGEFAFALAVTAPIFMFANLGLRFFQATDARREWTFGAYLGLRFLSAGIGFAVVVGLALALWQGRERLGVVIAVAGYKVFECLADIFYGLYQQRNRNDLIAVSLGAGSLLSLVCFALVFLSTRDLTVACISMAFGKLTVLVVYDNVQGRRLTTPIFGAEKVVAGKVTPGNLLNLVAVAWPLGVVAVLGSLATNIPRYAVEAISGEHALGIFAALSYLLFAGMAVARSISHPFLPLIASDYRNGDRRGFFRHLGQTVAAGGMVGLVGVLAAVIAGDEILSLLYGADYVGHGREFAWVMCAAVFAYMGLSIQYGLTAIRSIRAQAVLIGAETIIVLVAAWTLVGALGIQGGALTMLLGSGFEFFAGVLLVWYLTRSLTPASR